MSNVGEYVYDIINIPSTVLKKEVEKVLQICNVPYTSIKAYMLDDNFFNYRITTSNPFDPSISLNASTVLGNRIRAYQINKHDETLIFPTPQPYEPITYATDYHNLIILEYSKSVGDNAIVYMNDEFIDKQRNLFSYFLKKIGNNILNGKSIMNISLPIFLFDCRSLLELWVWQNAFCDEFLTKAGNTVDPLERIKHTVTFALTKLHLCVSQKKPFNPILGETFQCSIGKSKVYLEQTSHHPPRSNFYVIGPNYKLYGYNEPEANAGANTISVSSKGKLFVEFENGVKHEIYYPPMLMSGTLFGKRCIDFTGDLEVIDEVNDLFCYVRINPDDRGFIGKMLGSKETFPDYFSGVITSISKNGRYDVNTKMYSVIKNDSKVILCKLEGELSSNIIIDNNVVWEFCDSKFPLLVRMEGMLKSDSFYREDMWFLIEGDEDLAGRYKHVMEERQRRDRKLREEYAKKK